MKVLGAMTAVAAMLVGLSGPAFADGAKKMVCKVDGKVVKVKGKDDAAKKADCEKKSGTWGEGDAAPAGAGAGAGEGAGHGHGQ